MLFVLIGNEKCSLPIWRHGRVASRYVLEFNFLGIRRGFQAKRAAKRLRDEIAARLRGNDFDAGDGRPGDESVEPSGAYYLRREEIALIR